MASTFHTHPSISPFKIKKKVCCVQGDEVNCDKDHWLPVGTVPPDNPHCVEFDGSLIPDCGQYNLNNQTSYYHIHEYSACLSLVCKAVTVTVVLCCRLQQVLGVQPRGSLPVRVRLLPPGGRAVPRRAGALLRLQVTAIIWCGDTIVSCAAKIPAR